MTKNLLMLTEGNIDHASSRIRAIHYFPLLVNLLGYKVTLIPRVPVRRKDLAYRLLIFPILKRLLKIKRLLYITFHRADVIFIQRLFLSSFELYILKKRRKKIIYDFDDAIYLGAKNKSAHCKAVRMIRAVDRIIISTPYLEEFCRKSGKSARIITSPVDTDIFYPGSLTKNMNKLTIGWTGSHFTTKYLNLIAAPLQNLAEDCNYRLLLIGASRDFHLDGVQVEIHDWDLKSEPDLIREMDIGIMPLADDEWSKSKGGYKLFLYMASKIPVVASPVGINSMIVKHGENGFLANSPDEWYEYLKQLIENQLLRENFGQNGLNEARGKYSREACFNILKEEIEA